MDKLVAAILAAADRKTSVFCPGVGVLGMADPHLETGVSISLSWVSLVWAKNVGLMVALAGGLHLYLYRWSSQGKTLKFDASMANKDAKRFTLEIKFMIICFGLFSAGSPSGQGLKFYCYGQKLTISAIGSAFLTIQYCSLAYLL